MNAEQIKRKNEELQNQAARVTEAIPGENLFPFTSIVIRSLKKIDKVFPTLLQKQSDIRFFSQMEKLEEEVDEVVYALDKLHEINRKYENLYVNEAIKFGYELLSIYSMAADKIIERKVKNQVDEL